MSHENIEFDEFIERMYADLNKDVTSACEWWWNVRFDQISSLNVERDMKYLNGLKAKTINEGDNKSE